MAAWLSELAVTDAAMESTGIYWWPVYHALAAAEIEVCVCNAAHMRNVPGRKTDLLTELAGRSFRWCVRSPVMLARFRPRDQRRGYAAGGVRAGGPRPAQAGP
jgi:transposase